MYKKFDSDRMEQTARAIADALSSTGFDQVKQVDRSELLKRIKTRLANENRNISDEDRDAFSLFQRNCKAFFFADTTEAKHNLFSRYLAYTVIYPTKSANKVYSTFDNFISSFADKTPAQIRAWYASIMTKAKLTIASIAQDTQQEERDQPQQDQQEHKPQPVYQPESFPPEPEPIPDQDQPFYLDDQARRDAAEQSDTNKSERSGITFFTSTGYRVNILQYSDMAAIQPRKEILGKLALEQSINAISAEGGSKKTWTELREAVSFCTGKNFFGIVPDQIRRVLFVTLEMQARDIKGRIDQITNGMALSPEELDQFKKNFFLISYEDQHINAGDKHGIRAVVDTAKHCGATVVYIDAYMDFIAGLDIRNENDMTLLSNALRDTAVEANLTYRIIMHTNKGSMDNPAALAGSHTIRDMVDCVICLKDTDGELRLTTDTSVDKSAKIRGSKAITLFCNYEFGMDENGNDFLRFEPVEKSDTKSIVEARQKMLQAIEENQGANVKTLRDILSITGAQYSETARSLINSNEIVIDRQGKTFTTAPKYHYSKAYYDEHEQEITGQRKS